MSAGQDIRKQLRPLRDRMYVDLGGQEGVDKNMIQESIANYRIPEVDYTGKVCLDLGSNIGAFSKIALDQGAKKVVAVECDPRNVSIIENNALGKYDKKHFELIPAAVSMLKSKTLKIFKSGSNNKHCSTTIVGGKNRNFSEYDEVENVKYTKLIRKYKPDIIKIDIETAEYHMMDEIIKYAPDVLFIELHAGKYKPLMDPTVERLKEIYPIHRVDPLIVFQNVAGYDCFFMKDNKDGQTEEQ